MRRRFWSGATALGGPSRKVAIGVIGAGAIVADTHLPALLSRDDVLVTWVADIADGPLDRIRHRFGIPTVNVTSADDLPDADAILLAVPLGSRTGYHDELAGRGKPVYVEKPFAETRASAVALIAQYNVTPLACGLQRRTYASTHLLGRLTREGHFGTLRRISIREGALTTATRRAFDFRDVRDLSGGGILIDLGTHAIDVAFQISESTVGQVVGLDIIFDGDIDREVKVTALLSGGPSVVELEIHLSWLKDLGGRLRLEFDRGVLETGVTPTDPVQRITTSDRPELIPTDHSIFPTTSWSAVSAAWTCLLRPSDAVGTERMHPNSLLPTIALIEDVYGMAHI